MIVPRLGDNLITTAARSAAAALGAGRGKAFNEIDGPGRQEIVKRA
jgi:hypothetical protein